MAKLVESGPFQGMEIPNSLKVLGLKVNDLNTEDKERLLNLTEEMEGKDHRRNCEANNSAVFGLFQFDEAFLNEGVDVIKILNKYI
jgi:hypothetical protein